MRAGRYVKQPTDYRAFVPADLPPDPPVVLDAERARLLSDADRALGRLGGVATVLPRSRSVRGDVRSRRGGDEPPTRGDAKRALECVGVQGGCESGVAAGRCRRDRQERNRCDQYEPYVRLFDPDKSSIDRED
jgi:hypothetical protein